MQNKKKCACGCGRFTRLAPYTSTARSWVKGEPIDYVHGHHRRKKTPEYVEEDRGYETPCWIWQRAVTGPRKYGVAYDRETQHSGLAHRIYYKRFKGSIPKGLHLDHLCEQPSCVNPDHLEPVTCRENLRRGKGTKLSEAEIREMVLRHHDGESAYDLATEFGINVSHVHSMSRGAAAVLRLLP